MSSTAKAAVSRASSGIARSTSVPNLSHAGHLRFASCACCSKWTTDASMISISGAGHRPSQRTSSASTPANRKTPCGSGRSGRPPVRLPGRRNTTRLIYPQRVGSTQNQGQCCKHCIPHVGIKTCQDHHESPTNPEVPGKPTLAKAKITKKAANFGMLFTHPVICNLPAVHAVIQHPHTGTWPRI